MSEQPCAITLIESLRSVPILHRTEWEIQWADDGTPTGHQMCPVGKYCHEAADKITELEAELEGKLRVGVQLPVITNEVNNKFGDAQLIEDGDWSQDAVDFACFLNATLSRKVEVSDD